MEVIHAGPQLINVFVLILKSFGTHDDDLETQLAWSSAAIDDIVGSLIIKLLLVPGVARTMYAWAGAASTGGTRIAPNGSCRSTVLFSSSRVLCSQQANTRCTQFVQNLPETTTELSKALSKPSSTLLSQRIRFATVLLTQSWSHLQVCPSPYGALPVFSSPIVLL